MLRIKIFLSILLTSIICFSQSEIKRYRIKAQIIDAQTQEPLKNFPVKIKEFDRIVHANENGEFLFNMPVNTYTLIFDDYPYVKKEIVLELKADTTLEILLQTPPAVHRLREVDVIATKKFSKTPTNTTQLTSSEIALIPAMAGEKDILKALTLTSGISSSGEGAADIQVRGGLHGHNLLLLDKVPLYSTQHMLGMVSVYNPTIIKSVELYKSGFPSEFGGRIASVLDVRSKDPDLNRYSGEVDISLLSTKTALNIPVVKNSIGVSVAGRISNYSLINLVSIFTQGSKIKLHFADLNTSLLYKPTERDEIKLSYFYNSDGMSITEKQEIITEQLDQNNRQQNLIMKWIRKLKENKINTLQIYGDEFKFNYGSNTKKGNPAEDSFYKIHSSISSYGIENQLNNKVSEKFGLQSGISIKLYKFSPFNISATDTTYVRAETKANTIETSINTQAKYSISAAHKLVTGLRLSSFGNSSQTYFSAEPRISYHGLLTDNLSMSASVSKMTQNIHRVANPGMGFPMELFQPTDSFLKPEKSWIYSLGAAKDLKINQNNITLKAELWYKRMWNLVEFQDGFDAVSMLLYAPDNNSHYLTQGIGKAYGIDISGIYNSKKIKLNIDYTLMQAKNKFEKLNNGEWFVATTDIRHIVNVTSELKIRRNWTATASWQFRSGKPITLPTAIYPLNEIDFSSGLVTFTKDVDYHRANFQLIEGERNNARTRPFHKLDIALNHSYFIKKKYSANLSFGVYNVYNRANPAYYFIGYEKKGNDYYPVLKSISMFPILPSFSWSMKF